MNYSYPGDGPGRDAEPFKGYRDRSEDHVLRYAEYSFKSIPEGSLLDLGCGEGRLALHFAKYFKRVIALEPDEWRLAQSQKNAIEAGLNHLEFVGLPFLMRA